MCVAVLVRRGKQRYPVPDIFVALSPVRGQHMGAPTCEEAAAHAEQGSHQGEAPYPKYVDQREEVDGHGREGGGEQRREVRGHRRQGRRW